MEEISSLNIFLMIVKMENIGASGVEQVLEILMKPLLAFGGLGCGQYLASVRYQLLITGSSASSASDSN